MKFLMVIVLAIAFTHGYGQEVLYFEKIVDGYEIEVAIEKKGDWIYRRNRMSGQYLQVH